MVIVRAAFFGGTSLGVPIEWIAVLGTVLLIAVRWFSVGIGPSDLLKKTPWHVLLFAFGICVIVYGLSNIGLTAIIVSGMKESISSDPFHAIMIVGILVSLVSNLLNNLPSVMIGALSLMEMGLDPHILQITYLANIIGSSVGSLITPMGTLASLIWMFIVRKNNIAVTWSEYIRVTVAVIPLGTLFSLFCLYIWTAMVR
ncbi:ArsB/NhaD family transporter [Paenibacillus hamazuiensis]|uniref:ArsB/NhaD family transporter n=1 Tax=Paenibacillus hamazuiensis TaxID=2936508 RepID=UPI003083F48E